MLLTKLHDLLLVWRQSSDGGPRFVSSLSRCCCVVLIVAEIARYKSTPPPQSFSELEATDRQIGQEAAALVGTIKERTLETTGRASDAWRRAKTVQEREEKLRGRLLTPDLRVVIARAQGLRGDEARIRALAQAAGVDAQVLSDIVKHTVLLTPKV